MLSDANEGNADWVSPPGQTIIEILEELEWSLEEFATRIGHKPEVAQRVLDGAYSIDRNMASRLVRALGSTEQFWLAREYDYRASIEDADQADVSSLDDLVARLPISDMKKLGWIDRGEPKDRTADCLGFFGVSTFAQWQGRYLHAFDQAAYRRSAFHGCCEVSTTAWLRQGERLTKNDEVAEWSADILRGQIDNFKRLTWFKDPKLFLPRIRALLAQAGVKFAIVRTPKGCTASGAVRLLEGSTPHIQLSFRYLSDDQFWFSLFHEIAHLLLHKELMPFIERDDMKETEQEAEANEFAESIIVPPEYREEFLTLGSSKGPIIGLAKKIGVAPGLIVGQLQHQGLIRYNQMQHLKRRYRWIG